jgi:hypothetical protein
MSRGKRKIQVDSYQLQLWGEAKAPEMCWKCARPLVEVQKRGVTHDCPPACTRCGRGYYFSHRTSDRYRPWKARCGCDPYPKDRPPWSWCASEVPTRERRRPAVRGRMRGRLER